MKLEDVRVGRRVFWAGLSWHCGRMQPFIREGVILGERWNKVEVECPDGKRLLKKRDRLKLTRAEAEAHLERLCRS